MEGDTVLAAYTARFGEPIGVAHTEVPHLGPVQIGWVFHVPDSMVLPGPHEQFEMLLVPMVDDPAGGAPASLFVQLARQRRDFQGMFDAGEVDEFHHVTLKQRRPDEQPIPESEVQRRKN